jgi:DNA-binding response OmpR family regulator
MALIIVCEDDAATRALIVAVLSKAGHEVESFDNGLKAYVRLLDGDAELLVSDVQMPLKNGFELVADVRTEPALVNLPCILLTSLAERAHMRIGMTSGADDYVTKPFQPIELLAAVDSQLKRAMQRYMEQSRRLEQSVDKAVGERTNELMLMYENRLGIELQSRWARTDTQTVHLQGSLVGCTFMDAQRWQECLPERQLAELAKLYFGKLADSAAWLTADHVQFIGDGLLIAFDQQRDTPSVNHFSRALRLLQSLQTTQASVQAFAVNQWTRWNPPPFAACMTVHAGALSLAKLEGVTGGVDQLVPVGQAVSEMGKLLKASQTLRWPMAVSDAAWPGVQEAMVSDDHIEVKLKAQTLLLRRASLKSPD